MKKLLSDSGFSDKKLAVQQGGTYTGQDRKVNQMEEYQTEEDQASYLVKEQFICLPTEWSKFNLELMLKILVIMAQFITGSQ